MDGVQLVHKGDSTCEGDECNSSDNYIDDIIEKKKLAKMKI